MLNTIECTVRFIQGIESDKV